MQNECIRPGTPLMREDARRLIQHCVDHHNTVRLPSAIGFVIPADMLTGRQKKSTRPAIVNWRRLGGTASAAVNPTA